MTEGLSEGLLLIRITTTHKNSPVAKNILEMSGIVPMETSTHSADSGLRRSDTYCAVGNLGMSEHAKVHELSVGQERWVSQEGFYAHSHEQV